MINKSPPPIRKASTGESILYKIVFTVFAAWLGLTILSIAFAQITGLQIQRNDWYQTVPAYTLFIFAGAAAVFALFYFAARRIKFPSFRLTGKKFLIAFAAADIVLFAAQIFLFCNIYFETGWDAGLLIEIAQTIADGKPVEGFSQSYLSYYPNNRLLVSFFVLCIRFFSAVNIDTYFGLVIVNCTAINAGGVFLFFAAKKLLPSAKAALYCWIVYTLLITFSGWASIPYSDTFGLFFMASLLWLYASMFVSSPTEKRFRFRSFLFGFLAYTGYKIKPTVIFLLIAFCLIEGWRIITVKNRPHRFDALFVLPGALFAAEIIFVVLLFQPVILHSGWEFSFMHYLMMGANTENTGGYYGPDWDFSVSITDSAERFRANWNRYLERLSEQGFFGHLSLLLKKNILNFSDGMYAWGEEGGFYNRIPPEPLGGFSAALRQFWYNDTQNTAYSVHNLLAQCLHYWVLLTAIPALLKRKKDKNTAFVMLSLLMLAVFLMLFECRARYILLYMPLFILLSGVGLQSAAQRSRAKDGQTIEGALQLYRKINSSEKPAHTFAGESRSGTAARRYENMASTLYFVVPCYNEEEVLPETSKRLLEKLNELVARGDVSDDSRILFVDDGSKDKTWQIISALHEKDKHFSGVKESRNRGHQNALLAGLFTAAKYADVTISLDADLQDDIGAVDKMIEEYKKGYDVVYGVRSARKTDTFFKRATAEGFYKIMKAMGVDIVFNHADYRLMSRRAVEGLLQFKEVNLFLRGLVPMVGYPSSQVYYERAERFAGESKYPLKKMLAFAFEGITSFSTKPLKFINVFAVLLLLLGFAAIVATGVLYGLGYVGSWTILLSAMAFFTGVILLAVGIVGAYVGKNYMESKHRPSFIIEQVLNDAEEK